MTISFSKYHGAGNDFIMVDARKLDVSIFTEEWVAFLCDRHFGIGSDGLILLLDDRDTDFRMKYFNSDGREGTMCGNGGRCIAAFAGSLGVIGEKTTFSGIDGRHAAYFTPDGLVHLQMNVARGIQKLEDGYLLDTGSPHLVLFRRQIADIDVFSEGRALRYNERFMPGGVNVNFVELTDERSFKIRTYERGVENETLACGTGSVASALAASLYRGDESTSWNIAAVGGDLQVRFSRKGDEFYDIWLSGGATGVFNGSIEY